MREEQEASLRNFRFGFKAKLSQLEDYATSLYVWECQHGELDAKLRDVLEKQKIIKLMLEEEKRLVKEHQHEGREHQILLDGAATSLDTAGTMQELMAIVDTAEQVRLVAEDWIQRCNEAFPNVSVIQKSAKVSTASERNVDR